MTEVFLLLGPVALPTSSSACSPDLAEGGAACYCGFSVQEGGLGFLASPAVRFWTLLSGSCFKAPLSQKADNTTALQLQLMPPPTHASSSPQEPESYPGVGDGLAVLEEMVTRTSAWVDELRCGPCPASGSQAQLSLDFTPFLSHGPLLNPR